MADLERAEPLGGRHVRRAGYFLHTRALVGRGSGSGHGTRAESAEGAREMRVLCTCTVCLEGVVVW
jgi:hypothetical protein